MWSSIALNLHQLIDVGAQLNKTNINNHMSNNRGDTEAMVDRLLKVVKFELFTKGGNRCGTMYTIRKIIPNLGSINQN